MGEWRLRRGTKGVTRRAVVDEVVGATGVGAAAVASIRAGGMDCSFLRRGAGWYRCVRRRGRRRDRPSSVGSS